MRQIQGQSQPMPWLMAFGSLCSASSFTSFASICCCGTNASKLQWLSSILQLWLTWAHESHSSQCRVMKYSLRPRFTISLWFRLWRLWLSGWVTVRILSSSSLISHSSIVRRTSSTRGSSARSTYTCTACWLFGPSSLASISYSLTLMSRKVRLDNLSSLLCWASNYL